MRKRTYQSITRILRRNRRFENSWVVLHEAVRVECGNEEGGGLQRDEVVALYPETDIVDDEEEAGGTL